MIAYIFDINTKEITNVISGSYEIVMEYTYAYLCNAGSHAMTLDSSELHETEQTNYIRETEVSPC